MKKKLAALRSAASGGRSDSNSMGDSGSSASKKSSSGLPSSSSGGKIPEAKDAKEVAKKLVRSGAITAIQKSMEARAEKSRGFKRSQGLERKLTGGMDARSVRVLYIVQLFSVYTPPSGLYKFLSSLINNFMCFFPSINQANTLLQIILFRLRHLVIKLWNTRPIVYGINPFTPCRAGYQPFSATHGPSGGFDTGGEDMNPEPRDPPPKKVKNLYDSFVSARDREERGLASSDGVKPDKPRAGNTVYVFGYSITEDILRDTFAANGKIVNISMEVEKNCGFVTFDKSEHAERAIAEHHGSVAQGIQLKVSMARRQPVIEPINEASSSATWSTIAASHSQKGSHKDKREMVTYEEDIF